LSAAAGADVDAVVTGATGATDVRSNVAGWAWLAVLVMIASMVRSARSALAPGRRDGADPA
jgi:hypothetical protein